MYIGIVFICTSYVLLIYRELFARCAALQLFAVEKRVRHLEGEQKRQDTLITVGSVVVGVYIVWRLLAYLFGRGGGNDSGSFRLRH